jgi:hypothetical protein
MPALRPVSPPVVSLCSGYTVHVVTNGKCKRFGVDNVGTVAGGLAAWLAIEALKVSDAPCLKYAAAAPHCCCCWSGIITSHINHAEVGGCICHFVTMLATDQTRVCGAMLALQN